MMTALSEDLEQLLNEIGVVERTAKSHHAPIVWPEEKQSGAPKKSRAVWLPSYPGEQPPF